MMLSLQRYLAIPTPAQPWPLLLTEHAGEAFKRCSQESPNRFYGLFRGSNNETLRSVRVSYLIKQLF